VINSNIFWSQQAKQLGVIGRYQDGGAVEDFRQAPELLHPGVEKVARVTIGGLDGGLAVIGLFAG
jgi:hypothetical protein